jgi:RND superfamily putative drug exporter
MTPLKRSNNLAARMGRWSARHRKAAIIGWLAFVAVAFLLGGQLGMKTIDRNDTNVGEARTADHIIRDAGFSLEEQREYVLVQSNTATVSDAAFRAAVDDVLGTLAGFERAKDVRSPLAPGNEGQISADGHSALVEFTPAGDYDQATSYIETVTAAVDETADEHPGFTIVEAGSASTGKAMDDMFETQIKKAGLLSIPLTLGILLLVFGTIVAAGIPVLLALSAVLATVGLVAIPSQFIAMDQSISEVILLIGLAVGVDYTLFYLKREREERAAGRSAAAALEAAAATSGRSVLISGLTVMVAMAGMFLSGDKTFMSFAVGTILVVGVAMLGSLTVLPALLSKLGDNVERLRVPLLHRLRRPDREEGRLWGAILDRVLKRPLVSALAATAVLVAMAVPTFGLHTAISGADTIKDPAIEPYLQVQEAFPGGAEPAIVAIKAGDVTSAPVQAALADLEREALATGRMLDPIRTDISPDHTVARVSIPLAGKGTDDASTEALATLREDVLPATVGRLDGVEYAVTGTTAATQDFNSAMKSSIPYVFGFVLVLAFGLLLVAFRSIVIAAKAIVLNLLSVAAAYGLLVAVFQWGWGENLLNFNSNGGIAAWLPLFLFVILFGLSMDYHVFILSRIREAFDRGLSTEEAVAHGIKTTAGVVTSAAVVMVGVFGVFATLPFIDMKEMGIGLAAAVLIDATIVRAVLLPAVMKLLGDWNWYLPRWLEWLPRLEHEEQAPRSIPAPAPAGR